MTKPNNQWELHVGDWGSVPGDGYKLISTQTLSQHATREEAWEAFYVAAAQGEFDPVELLVQKPEFSNNARGWPTFWDDPPDQGRWRDTIRDSVKARTHSA
jgi:hypothetical protein